jgi:hypothetical protein
MEHSSTPVVTILNRLEDPTLELHESHFLTFGDDILDTVIGIDVIKSNAWLLSADPLPVGIYHGDSISVGSGPSLDQYIPFLREAQDKVLIVASHSAIPRLISCGITPHVIVPKERLPDPDKIPLPLPSSVVYAGLPLVPHAPDMCSRHYLVGDVGKVSRWLGISREDIPVSTTSGTLSAWVAARMATGTCWLVGHDLAQGHYAGFAFAEEKQCGSVMCADGVERASNRVYRQALNELEGMATMCRIVQCAPGGAVIKGAESKPLSPVLGDKPCLQPRPVGRTTANGTRMWLIGQIIRQAVERAEKATDANGLVVGALFDKDDHQLGQVLLQTVYLSVSILRRTVPLTEPQAYTMLRDAILNSFRSLQYWADHGS